MTIVVVRNVAARFRGFLASCMLEIAPGVYTAPRMTAGVRERVWQVLVAWFDALGEGSIVMTWTDRTSVVGQSVRVLGVPARILEDYEGFVVARRDQPAEAL
jgi:CRISPR-associated protein Cas2